MSSSGRALCFVLQCYAKTLRHPVQRAAVDPKRFRGARTIAAHSLQYVNEISPFEFVERRKILEHPLLERGRRENRIGQVGQLNPPSAEDDQPLDGVFQLAHIAWPAA